MHTRNALPHSLLELVCHRISQSNARALDLQNLGRVRQLQHFATDSLPQSGAVGPSIYVFQSSARKRKSGSGSFAPILEQGQTQIRALEDLEAKLAAMESSLPVSQKDDAPDEQLTYADAELNDMYKDLLAFPEEDQTTSQKQPQASITNAKLQSLIYTLEQRLAEFDDAEKSNSNLLPSTSLAAQLLADRRDSKPQPPRVNIKKDLLPVDNAPSASAASLRDVINRLQVRLTKLNTLSSDKGSMSCIPITVISGEELNGLLQACLTTNDPLASEKVLKIIQLTGIVPTEDQYDLPLNWYASNGYVEATDTYALRMGLELNDRFRDRLIKARLKASRLDDACSLIHQYEYDATPAPIQSYNRVIQTMLYKKGSGSELLKAQAWDMFSHMRYAAHAVPDERLYTMMIRAIAETQNPEAERALDLFHEMTVDNRIRPTTYTYNAAILACARSRNFKLEAFRLARQMINSLRDAEGRVPARVLPNSHTFQALLEAAKRMGDLGRTRWLLGLMVKESLRDPMIKVNEKVMTHVFQVYAAYVPPFQREAILQEKAAESEDKYGETEATQPEGETQDNIFSETSTTFLSSSQQPHPPWPSPQAVAKSRKRRPHPPQTRQEVIREASLLWSRILQDQSYTHTRSEAYSEMSRHRPFFHVRLTTQLIDAYLAVHFNHAPPEESYPLWTELHPALGIERDANSYLLAINAYASGRFPDAVNRSALEFVRTGIWEEWRAYEVRKGVQQMEGTGEGNEELRKVDARMVEKIWVAYIRLLALTWNLPEALKVLNEFVSLYPPMRVGQPAPVPSSRSSKVRLYAHRPLVRLTEPTTVPEDRITPFMTFRDIDLLHGRCVIKRRVKDINYLTWVGKAYEGNLRKRRDLTLKGEVRQSGEDRDTEVEEVSERSERKGFGLK